MEGYAVSTALHEIEIDSRLFEHLGKARIKKATTSEVVMVIPRTDGRVLLMIKRFYPQGLFRLPTGGMARGETPEAAFLREAREETGLPVEIDKYLGKIDYLFVYNGDRQSFTSYVFLAKPKDGNLAPEDEDEEITEFREVFPEELERVAEELEGLEQIAPEWAGWGRFRAVAHRFVAEKLVQPCGD